MRNKTFATSLLIAILASSTSGFVFGKQSKMIELVAKAGGPPIATIRVGAQSVVLEFDNNSNVAAFTEEAVLTINNTDRTYRVQSYADLEASLRRKTKELGTSSEASTGVELNLTKETVTISGLSARKLIKINNGKVEAELWMSIELMPPMLRARAERLRSVLPNDYWRRAHGNPGMVEMVMLFGIPLRIDQGSDTILARIGESPSGALFQVPTGYKKLDN